MQDWNRVQGALQYAARNPGRNVLLRELAAETRQSVFHAHRTLRRALGETPKQYTWRLRVDRAASMLLVSRGSILEIGLECGFESHETFCRAFRRRFRMSPTAYRKRGLSGAGAPEHANFVNEIGPCVGLYQVDVKERNSREPVDYIIERRELAAQPVLVVRKRVRRTEIATTIGAELPRVFLSAQQRGIAISGYPITRYLETSIGLVTLETGLRVSAHKGEWKVGDGEGGVVAGMLPGGPAAVTIHCGPYDQLQGAYAALEEWIAAKGFESAGAPWEAYLNDPADHPNPRDWKTEVCWPLRA